MSAPKGNKYGKQFSKDYQPPEKWTEKKALELGEELIDWLTETDEDGEDNGNILYDEFLVIKKKLYPETIAYLSNKFMSFLKLIEKAKKIQEIKLHKYGLADRLNASMCKFSLNVNHGWVEKKQIDQTNKTELSIKKLSNKEIKKISDKLDELY